MANQQPTQRGAFQNAKHNTAKFLGLTTANEFDQIAWNNRRLRYAAKKYGGLNRDKLRENTAKTQQQLLPAVQGEGQGDVTDNAPVPGAMARGAVRARLCLYDDHPLSDPGVCKAKQNVFSVAATTLRKRPQQDAGIEMQARPVVGAVSAQQEAVDEEDGHVHVANCLERLTCSEERMHKELSNVHDYRPYFTYWATFVQLVVFITSVAVYWFAPVSVGVNMETSYVLTKNLVQENVQVRVPANFWIGMRVQDIVHLGARFAPCMRSDPKVYASIELCASTEKSMAGCCIYADGSGCFGSLGFPQVCSPLRSRFYKWKADSEDRKSGPLCGEDPRYCAEPYSTPPFVWPDDVSQWPICRKLDNSSTSLLADKNPSLPTAHMTCDVVARPCCVGVLGECMITTREHCAFVRGYFHQDAFTCSQVNCLADVCGMIPFLDPKKPDQFYRLFLSLFLHAGVIPLLITIAFQAIFMRDLEKVIGCVRMAIIYILSGMMGNLGSCIFLPYEAQTGPTSAQFGVLALGLVDLLLAWNILENPCIALLKYMAVVLGLFVIGVLPWIDNFANLFGFISGFLISLILMPYFTVSSSKEDSPEEINRRMKCVRVAIVLICLPLLLGILAGLVLLFYLYPLDNCEWCNWINCIPFTSNFCQNNFNVDPRKPSCYIDETRPNQGMLT